MNELALFAGAGGGILGGVLLGWNCIGAVEIEKYPRKVLLSRQCDGLLPEFPIWDDVRTFDGKPWRGLVDVVSGGFPCQDISCAGKCIGINGERSGLWAEMQRIICEIRPRFAFMENSPMLTSRGLGRVLGDLAEAGYNACWTCLSASDCGAPHKRERIWILASAGGHERNIPNSNQLRRRTSSATWDIQAEQPHALRIRGTSGGGEVPDSASCGQQIRIQADAREHNEKSGTAPDESGSRCAAPSNLDLPRREKQRQPEPAGAEQQAFERCGWWSVEPGLGRVADGVANRVDRLKALGNGQVPIVAATAFSMLYKQLTGKEYNQ